MPEAAAGIQRERRAQRIRIALREEIRIMSFEKGETASEQQHTQQRAA